jgi:hypothetical protein
MIGDAVKARHRAVLPSAVRFASSTPPHIVCASIGLDVASETIPYIAGWENDDALNAITTFPQIIKDLAAKLEEAARPGAYTRSE